MTEYTIDLILPSKGKPYGDLIPDGKIVIRALNTNDEKVLFSGSSTNSINKAISGCIIKPDKVNLYDLVDQDQYFIIIELRRLTYGDNYSFEDICPECGRKFTQAINLDGLANSCTELDDDIKYPFQIELPKSKHKVEVKLLTGKDQEEIDQILSSIKSKTVNLQEMEYDLRLSKTLVSVNNNPVTLNEARDFIFGDNPLHSLDSAKIFHTLSKNYFGYNTAIQYNCPHCNTEIEKNLPMGTEFFRPSFDD